MSDSQPDDALHRYSTNDYDCYAVKMVLAVPRYGSEDTNTELSVSALDILHEGLPPDVIVLHQEERRLAFYGQRFDPEADSDTETKWRFVGECQMFADGNWCRNIGMITRTYVRPNTKAGYVLRAVCASCARKYGVEF